MQVIRARRRPLFPHSGLFRALAGFYAPEAHHHPRFPDFLELKLIDTFRAYIPKSQGFGNELMPWRLKAHASFY